MLNRSAFNKAAFNSTAAVVLVLGSAIWSAEATVTSAAVQNHALTATIDCSAQAIFGAYKHLYAFANLSAEAVSTFSANTIFAGSGNWEPESTLQMYVLSVINAEAGFDTYSEFTALPNAKFADGDWVSSGGFEGIPTLTGALVSPINAGGVFDASGDVARMVIGDWSNTAHSWFEPTITSGGISYHDGYAFLEGDCEFENIPYLTATFTNGAFQQAGADWALNATGVYAAVGHWGNVAIFTGVGNRTVFAALSNTATAVTSFTATHRIKSDAAMEAGAVISIVGTTVKLAKATIQGDATFVSSPVVIKAASMDLAPTCELSITPLRFAMVEMPLISGVSFTLDGTRIQFSNLDWNGDASSLAGGAVLTTAPAPAERIIKVSAQNRIVYVAGDNRNLEVSV